jgi:hypothetical protein
LGTDFTKTEKRKDENGAIQLTAKEKDKDISALAHILK